MRSKFFSSMLVGLVAFVSTANAGEFPTFIAVPTSSGAAAQFCPVGDSGQVNTPQGTTLTLYSHGKVVDSLIVTNLDDKCAGYVCDSCVITSKKTSVANGLYLAFLKQSPDISEYSERFSNQNELEARIDKLVKSSPAYKNVMMQKAKTIFKDGDRVYGIVFYYGKESGTKEKPRVDSMLFIVADLSGEPKIVSQKCDVVEIWEEEEARDYARSTVKFDVFKMNGKLFVAFLEYDPLFQDAKAIVKTLPGLLASPEFLR